MATKLKNNDINKVDLVPKGAQQYSKIAITKSFKEEDSMANNKVSKSLSAEELDSIEELLGKLKAKLEGTGEVGAEKEDNIELEDTGEDEDEDVDEEVNVDPTITKSDLTKSEKANIKKMEALEAKIAKMEDEKVTKEFIAKAEELEYIPEVTSEELGKVMKSFYLKDPKQYEVIEKVLKACNSLIETSGTFEEYGTSRGESVVNKADAGVKYEALVDTFVAKGLSRSKAYEAVNKTAEGIRLYNMQG